MAQRLNKDQQWREVIQGLALGCLTLGEEDLPGSKIEAEFAFSYAWRRWSFAYEYLSIRDRDFFVYVHKSQRRMGGYAAFDSKGRLTPYLLIEGWNAEESLEVFTEDESIPEFAWVELAQLFVDRLLRHDR